MKPQDIPSLTDNGASHPLVHLCALNTALADAWSQAFVGVERVRVSVGNILDFPGDAVVSPANSFGYMNGGIDRIYLFRFGDALVVRLQNLLAEQFGGELPVGQAVIVQTGDAAIAYLVSAPTMREPEDVSGTQNAYLAFRAVLRAVHSHNDNLAGTGATRIRTVLCPGLATGTGKMPVDVCAAQMRRAYDEYYTEPRDTSRY